MGFGRVRAAAGWVLVAVALALPLVDALLRMALDAGEESALSGTGAGVVLLALAIGLLYERERECDRMRGGDGEAGSHEVMEAALFSMLVRCVIGGLVLAAWLFRDVLRGWGMV